MSNVLHGCCGETAGQIISQFCPPLWQQPDSGDSMYNFNSMHEHSYSLIPCMPSLKLKGKKRKRKEKA